MQIIDKRWDCRAIAHSSRYLATMGNGVTIWMRDTMERIHHFTGMRWIHGGLFVNDDVLMVYTGEQKIYFLGIPEKRILWAIPRPGEFAASGDMRCCSIPDTEKVACIASGKASMDEFFFLLIDWSSREFSFWRVPDCYRVIQSLVWTRRLGLTFLSYQAKGDNVSLVYRIFRATETGAFPLLYDGESPLISQAYSGSFLFLADYGGQEPQMFVCSLEPSAQGERLELGKPRLLPIPTLGRKAGPGSIRRVLPYVKWVDEESGLLTVCHPMKWIGVCDFQNQTLTAAYLNSSVDYGEVLDGQLLLGLAPGFSIMPSHTQRIPLPDADNQ